MSLKCWLHFFFVFSLIFLYVTEAKEALGKKGEVTEEEGEGQEETEDGSEDEMED